MIETLYNPEKIFGFMHKNKGSIELADNQQFQAVYTNNANGRELKKLEIWQERNGLQYKVCSFLAKTILVTYHN